MTFWNIPLSDILDCVGLVTARQAFISDETLRVTVNGVAYEIAVTDEPGAASAGTDFATVTPSSPGGGNDEWSPAVP